MLIRLGLAERAPRLLARLEALDAAPPHTMRPLFPDDGTVTEFSKYE